MQRLATSSGVLPKRNFALMLVQAGIFCWRSDKRSSEKIFKADG
jgi:hypothetical protein